jgi:hypothetical protein
LIEAAPEKKQAGIAEIIIERLRNRQSQVDGVCPIGGGILRFA